MEANNIVAMREALEFASMVLAKWRQDAPFRAWNEYGEAIDKCRAALDVPMRNCDTGTADEQLPRFVSAWEVAHRSVVDKRSIIMLSVFSRWAQMPYQKEDGDKYKN